MTRPTVRATAVFATASLVAVAAGCWAVAAHGTPPGLWARNLAAWAVGGLLALATAKTPAARVAVAIVAGATALLALTLVTPGLQDVHRWLAAGPVRLNAAQLVLPAALVAWTLAAGRGGWRSCLLIPACAITAAQPDASQATALAGAVAIGLAALPSRTWWEGFALVAAGSLALLAWLRPDPLLPVAEVEGVMRLAADASLPLAAVAAAALSAAAVAPAIALRGAAGPAGLALVGYLGLTALAPIVGAFSVPWVGIGVSPILGAWLGFGLWRSGARRAFAA